MNSSVRLPVESAKGTTYLKLGSLDCSLLMLVLTGVNKGGARAEAGGAVGMVYPVLTCLTVPHGEAVSPTSHPAEQLEDRHIQWFDQ